MFAISVMKRNRRFTSWPVTIRPCSSNFVAIIVHFRPCSLYSSRICLSSSSVHPRSATLSRRRDSVRGRKGPRNSFLTTRENSLNLPDRQPRSPEITYSVVYCGSSAHLGLKLELIAWGGKRKRHRWERRTIFRLYLPKSLRYIYLSFSNAWKS